MHMCLIRRLPLAFRLFSALDRYFFSEPNRYATASGVRFNTRSAEGAQEPPGEVARWQSHAPDPQAAADAMQDAGFRGNGLGSSWSLHAFILYTIVVLDSCSLWIGKVPAQSTVICRHAPVTHAPLFCLLVL